MKCWPEKQADSTKSNVFDSAGTNHRCGTITRII